MSLPFTTHSHTPRYGLADAVLDSSRTLIAKPIQLPCTQFTLACSPQLLGNDMQTLARWIAHRVLMERQGHLFWDTICERVVMDLNVTGADRQHQAILHQQHAKRVWVVLKPARGEGA